MYHVAVCDDESMSRNLLCGYIDRFGAETGKALRRAVFSSANELLRDYPNGLDLLLLDIRMGGIDGMTAAKEIRAFDSQVCLIFITTEHQFALEGYSVRAFGFLKKPVGYTQFRHELTSALNHIDSLRVRYSVLRGTKPLGGGVPSGRSPLLPLSDEGAGGTADPVWLFPLPCVLSGKQRPHRPH